MCYHHYADRGIPLPGPVDTSSDRGRLVTDGGNPDDDAESGGEDAGTSREDEEPEAGATDDGDADEGNADTAESQPSGGDETAGRDGAADPDPDPNPDPDPDPDPGVDGSNVEVTDEAKPAEPRWEELDLEDLPEFELGAEGPLTKGTGTGSGSPGSGPAGGESADPGAGMPNTARSPEATRISSEGTEAYVVAFEVCAQLPDDVRLPEEAADLVPAAVEAELEEDVQQFAAAEFGIGTPHVDTLDFEEVDGEIWLRLRIGLPATDFADLDPEAVRSYALEQLEGVL